LVTVGELDAGSIKCPPYRRDRSLLEVISALKSQHGVDRHLCRSGKVPNTQAESPPSHATLDRQKNRNIVMIPLQTISSRRSANKQSFDMSLGFYSQCKLN
jgi:hypothetical protein